jgi:hypothetical protein
VLPQRHSHFLNNFCGADSIVAEPILPGLPKKLKIYLADLF